MSPSKFAPVIIASTIGVLGVLGCQRSGQPPSNDSRADSAASSSSRVEDVQVSAAAARAESIRNGVRAIRQADWQAAETAVKRLLLANPHDPDGLELSGDLASARDDLTLAIRMYRDAIAHSESPREPLLDKLAQHLMVRGKAYDCLELLHDRVARFPNSAEARFDLIGLATMLGRTVEAIPSLQWLFLNGQGDPESLQVLSDPMRVEPDQDWCARLLAKHPGETRLHYGLAKADALQLRWADVASRLQPVVEAHREFVPAYTLYGRALAQLGKFDEMSDWQMQMPAGAEESAEFWFVMGCWAEQQAIHAQAASAFWKAIKLSPSSFPPALAKLSLNLRLSGRNDQALIVAEQVSRHAALHDALKTHFERQGKSQLAALDVAHRMSELGRPWEAEGWARLAGTLPQDRQADMASRYRSFRAKLNSSTPWQLPEFALTERLNLVDLPPVELVVHRSTSSLESDGSGHATGKIVFEDQARQRGWVHTCEIAAEAAQAGHWIYQSVGGGVGVIDYDLDGWPDLAVAMLNGTPRESDSDANQLYRNLAGRFVNLTLPSGYQDTGFSHGICVGDYNNDGFPDLYDANLGRNRLYRNNGDGTFARVSDDALKSDPEWTTSAVLADIDGDGTTDIFEVCYCGGDAPYQQSCRGHRGIATCPPLNFEACKDRVWQGKGDGTFRDVTQQWLEQNSPGRGLGVVAGQFDERPGLDLYIANDMTVNHLWSAESHGSEFALRDLGAARGLGVSGRSQSQASMGMAVGDPDQDGDCDFFVTHFSDDHNTFYEQVGPGFWTDRSFQVGLSEPSMKLLGFGTEWIDFDNDGTQELMVANGHVDDVKREDLAYRMPAQIFRRQQDGRWVELDRPELGEYFQADHLGRALVSLDVDRDGRTDVAVTHLYDPVSLLVNRSQDCGTSISLELKSIRGQRDAIGSIATMEINGQKVSAQLTAGDGYMCTNQRRITIGAGRARQVDEVVIQWPSGTRERFGSLATGADHLLVEGSGIAHQLQRHH